MDAADLVDHDGYDGASMLRRVVVRLTRNVRTAILRVDNPVSVRVGWATMFARI